MRKIESFDRDNHCPSSYEWGFSQAYRSYPLPPRPSTCVSVRTWYRVLTKMEANSKPPVGDPKQLQIGTHDRSMN